VGTGRSRVVGVKGVRGEHRNEQLPVESRLVTHRKGISAPFWRKQRFSYFGHVVRLSFQISRHGSIALSFEVGRIGSRRRRNPRVPRSISGFLHRISPCLSARGRGSVGVPRRVSRFLHLIFASISARGRGSVGVPRRVSRFLHLVFAGIRARGRGSVGVPRRVSASRRAFVDCVFGGVALASNLCCSLVLADGHDETIVGHRIKVGGVVDDGRIVVEDHPGVGVPPVGFPAPFDDAQPLAEGIETGDLIIISQLVDDNVGLVVVDVDARGAVLLVQPALERHRQHNEPFGVVDGLDAQVEDVVGGSFGDVHDLVVELVLVRHCRRSHFHGGIHTRVQTRGSARLRNGDNEMPVDGTIRWVAVEEDCGSAHLCRVDEHLFGPVVHFAAGVEFVRAIARLPVDVGLTHEVRCSDGDAEVAFEFAEAVGRANRSCCQLSIQIGDCLPAEVCEVLAADDLSVIEDLFL
jgi:hypothetical protein